MRKALIIFFVLVSTFVLGQEVQLKIIETSDLHGCIFPYDFISQKDKTESLASAMTYIREQREQPNQNVLLFDNGDILQGQPVAYYYNFEDTTSEHIFSKVMNYMKYNAATIGNHDIETGHAVYDRIKKTFNFKWLAANVVNKATGKPYLEPYVVFIVKGVKIAVLGLTTPGVPNWLPESLWSGLQFEDMVESAKKWVKIINEKENPDLLLGLFHSGIDYNYGGQSYETYCNENATLIVAEQVPGFDIIFSGHDHEVYNEWIENVAGEKVLVLNPASHARFLATASIKLNKQQDGTFKKQIMPEVVDISNLKADPDFLKTFNNDFETVKKYVSKPVTVFNNSIDSREAFVGPTEIIELIHKVQLEQTKADISFAAPLNFYYEIDSGPVYVSDMFKLYRFENLLYTMQLSGNEIKNYLEYSYSNWFSTMKDTSSFLFNYKLTDGSQFHKLVRPFYNFDSGYGIKYTVDVTKDAGERIKIISMQDGTDFNPEKTYKVAINSYRGNGGGGHLTAGAGIEWQNLGNRVVASTTHDIRYIMMHWLNEQNEFVTSCTYNWKVIPEDFVKYRWQTEEKWLFNRTNFK